MQICTPILKSLRRATGLSLYALSIMSLGQIGCGQPADSGQTADQTIEQSPAKTNTMNQEMLNLSPDGQNQEATNAKTESGADNTAGRKIRNGIQFEEHGGLFLEQAFLLSSSDHLIAEDNLVNAGERFKMILYIKNWKDDKGIVTLGASELLVTSEEDIIVKESDLFAGHNEVSLKDAGILTLSMQVTKAKRLFDFYQVHFRVFNKTHDQWIEGVYRFNLK